MAASVARALALTTSLVLLLGFFESSAQDVSVCKRLMNPKHSDAGKKPPVVELTVDEKVKGMFTRACLKSYSAGFPGGEDAFLKADSDSIRKDLKLVTGLFDQYKGGQKFAEVKTDPNYLRKEHIELGWDRNQVLLWGNFFYMLRLYKEGQYEKVLSMADEIKRTYGLTVKPLASWDDLEEKTYYSKQSLKNIIALIVYRAHAQLDTDDSAAQISLAKSFIADRDALRPFLDTYGDPTTEILGPYCDQVKP